MPYSVRVTVNYIFTLDDDSEMIKELRETEGLPENVVVTSDDLHDYLRHWSQEDDFFNALCEYDYDPRIDIDVR